MATDKKNYGALYQEHYFEQYKLYLNSIEKISDRRETANRYFLSVNSAIILVISVIIQYAHANRVFLALGATIFGFLISILFWVLINSYKQLNTAKFKVLHRIERRLPLELYSDEWDELGRGKNKKMYFPFSHVERIIPIIFCLGYLAAGLFIASRFIHIK